VRKVLSPSSSRRPAKTAPDGEVRILAGSWRGRRLRFVATDGLRPTGSRIRETLFNWIAPELPGSRCLDAFSGSGALGFESLSRGAASLVMLEPNPLAHQQLQQNAQLLGATGASIHRQTAQAYLAYQPVQPFDGVFLDPPFALDLWPELIHQLETGHWLAPDAWIYIETPHDYTLTTPKRWQLHRDKHAGQVRYCLFRCHADEAASP
jgi:16S rRNA (guanine966-N2)-methyltransferase